MPEQPGITCPVCGATSYNDDDITHGYCGACHDYTGAMKSLIGTMPFDEVAAAMHYDRQGHVISLARWCWLYEQRGPGGYAYIARDELPDNILVSTVWEGISIPLIEPPMMFETAIFIDGELADQHGYSTEAEAIATHQTLVRSLRLVGREFLKEELRTLDEVAAEFGIDPDELRGVIEGDE